MDSRRNFSSQYAGGPSQLLLNDGRFRFGLDRDEQSTRIREGLNVHDEQFLQDWIGAARQRQMKCLFDLPAKLHRLAITTIIDTVLTAE